MLFKISFSDVISISEDECIYTSKYLSEYSSVLGIRVFVPHLIKFDVGGIRRWRGIDIGDCVNAQCVQGIDAPGVNYRNTYTLVCFQIIIKNTQRATIHTDVSSYPMMGISPVAFTL